jgi:predicted acetyltransferase
MELIRPRAEHLASYVAALESGWSADNVRGAPAAVEELERLRADPERFIALQEDREALGGPIALPDGSIVARLPGLRRWMWDGTFCGAINLRWQRGTEALPPHCLGHVGYAVIPAKRRLGYATQALRDILPLACADGLRWIELTTDADNAASQRAIEANGGVLVEHFDKPEVFGGHTGLRYRIMLA